MRPTKINVLQLFVFSAFCVGGLGENVWINWNGPTGSTASAQGKYGPYSYYSGATGTLTLGPTLTNVTYTGETLSAFSSYSGGNGSFWTSTNYTATAAQTCPTDAGLPICACAPTGHAFTAGRSAPGSPLPPWPSA